MFKFTTASGITISVNEIDQKIDKNSIIEVYYKVIYSKELSSHDKQIINDTMQKPKAQLVMTSNTGNVVVDCQDIELMQIQNNFLTALQILQQTRHSSFNEYAMSLLSEFSESDRLEIEAKIRNS